MSNRVGTITCGQLISNLTSRLKEYTSKTITSETWRQIINAKVNMVHEVMGTKDKAIYEDNVIISGNSSTATILTGMATINPNSNIINLNCSGGIAYLGSGGGTTIGLKGALIFLPTSGVNYLLEAISGSYSTTTHLGTAVLKQTYNVDEGVPFYLYVGSTDDKIDLSSQSYYKQIDQILSIHDNVLDDEYVRCDTINDFFGFKKKQLPYNYCDSVAWIRDGENLLFAKGKNITGYGVRTMYYTRKPYDVTSDTDIVDMPASNIDLITSLCLLAGIQTLKVPIPNELKSAENQIAAMQKAKDKEISAILNNIPEN